MERDLDATGLTPCPARGCKFVYSDWRDIVPDSIQVNGKYRVFRLELTEGGLEQTFFVKAPMDGVVFRIDDRALNSGMGVWESSCSSCRIIGLRPNHGLIRGARIINDEHSEIQKWVLDIDINLSDGHSVNKILKTKQIFYPDFYKPDLLQ